MSTDPNFFDELKTRGLVQDSTDEQVLKQRLAESPIGVYYGCDPTAPSLHVGNLIGLVTLKRFQQAGHRPIPLAGGATGMIGDPSGRSDERNLLGEEQLAKNLAGIEGALRRFVDFDGVSQPAELVNNRTWTEPISMLEFLRDVGKHVTINQMVAKDSVKSRMEGSDGISFTEFSYMLLQAHDFAWLYENKNCEMQIGGSDQWGNISLGVDLVRRRSGGKAHALTWPLLTRKDGSKYGKTAGGETLWLDPEMMSPYKFYQAWIQTEDDELRKLFLWLTFLSVEEIDELVSDHMKAPHERHGQKRLARELTALVHGEEVVTPVMQASAALFGADAAQLAGETFEVLSSEIPTTEFEVSRLGEDGNFLPMLVEAGVASSNSEANRLLKQNGVSVASVKPAADFVLEPSHLEHNRYCLVRKGKKSVFLWDFK